MKPGLVFALLASTLALVAAAACGGGSSRPPATTEASRTASSCASPGAVAPEGCWTMVRPLGSGGFPLQPGSRDQPKWEPGKIPVTLTPLVAFGGELWMTGQVVAYSSPDGLTWTQHEKTDWGGRIYHAVVYFKGKLWMYGGLDYEKREFFNDIWSSSDGKAWSRAGTAAWPARGAQSMAVYQDRLWLFGGANHIAQDRSTDGFANDVWVSDDGLEWKQVTSSAPWSGRDYPGIAVLNDELYLVGGHDNDNADVWRTRDGKDWTQVTAEAPWKGRNGYAKVAFDGRLWILGGWEGRPTNALNDVWYSTDGETWERQAEHAPWGPRSPITLVFQDRLWIYSGKHTGANDNWGGDLWQMAARPTG